MTSTALVLIDFQNEWIDKNSEYYVGDIKEVIKKVNLILDYARKKEYKIIFTKHIEKDSQEEFVEGSENVEIISEINKKESDTYINKNKINPFFKTNLEQELKDIDKVIVCGILTNLCVRSFIQEAYDRDLEIKVIKDGCVAFDDEIQKFTFKDLKATREEIEFLNSEELID